MIPDGYYIAEEVFSTRECARLIDLLDKLPAAKGKAGVRNLMEQEWVRTLAYDPRLISITERVYGRQLMPYKAMLFAKTAKANWLVAWHQDTALPIDQACRTNGWSAPSRKADRIFAHAPASVLRNVWALRIHLDASTPANGPLRVIPRSHTQGVLTDAEIRRLINGSPQVECVVGRGGVVAISPLLLHASSKLDSDAPRRVLHIEYAESLEIDEGVKLVVS